MQGIVVAVVALGFMGSAPGLSSRPVSANYGESLQATRQAERPLLIVLDDAAHREKRIDGAGSAGDSIDRKAVNLLRYYELCRVDVSTEYGRRVARAFRATQYPYTAIIDRTGSVILFQRQGRMDSDQWQFALSQHRSGVQRVSPTSYENPLPSRFSISSSPAFCAT